MEVVVLCMGGSSSERGKRRGEAHRDALDAHCVGASVYYD